MTAVIDVVAANGVPFRVVFYRPGEEGPYPAAADPEHALVEFYDARYPHTEHGQFTGGRYGALRLVESEGSALDLDRGIDAWKIDAYTMVVVRKWINLHLTRAATGAPA